MLIVPASTAACAGIAIGLSKDLLQRAAEVNLKERRPVVVVPRETPVSRSHLTHLVALIDAGAVVLPASPGFYAAGATRQLGATRRLHRRQGARRGRRRAHPCSNGGAASWAAGSRAA